jgi:hypothetical protein
MKNRGWRSLFVCLTLATLAMACESTEPGLDPKPDGAPATGAAGATDARPGPTGGAVPDAGSAGPDVAPPPAPEAGAMAPSDAGGAAASCGRSSGACVNASDCGKSRADMQAKVAECGRRCLGAASCTATCMKDLPLTAGCAQCWGAVVQCGRDNCLARCSAATDSPDCRACTASAGCDGTFATCSGL